MQPELHHLSEENRIHKSLINQLFSIAKKEANIQSEIKTLRSKIKDLNNMEQKQENALHALQQSGQLIAEVLKQITSDKFIVKASNGTRYVVGCKESINKSLLKSGDRVALDFVTLTIMVCHIITTSHFQNKTLNL